jgi:hypothetical protein
MRCYRQTPRRYQQHKCANAARPADTKQRLHVVTGNCIFVIALSSKIIHCVAFADKLVVAPSPYCLAYGEDVGFRIRSRQ